MPHESSVRERFIATRHSHFARPAARASADASVMWQFFKSSWRSGTRVRASERALAVDNPPPRKAPHKSRPRKWRAESVAGDSETSEGEAIEVDASIAKAIELYAHRDCPKLGWRRAGHPVSTSGPAAGHVALTGRARAKTRQDFRALPSVTKTQPSIAPTFLHATPLLSLSLSPSRPTSLPLFHVHSLFHAHSVSLPPNAPLAPHTPHSSFPTSPFRSRFPWNESSLSYRSCPSSRRPSPAS